MKNFYSLRKGIFLLLSLMAFSYSAHSQISITWSGAGDGTTWSDGLNWNGGVVPGPGTNAVFQDFDATVIFTTSPTIDVLDIRANRNVTLDLGNETLSVGAPGKSNVVKIDANSTLGILSGTVDVTTDATRDAFQFRGGSGTFDLAAGAIINISGKKGIWSRPDATGGTINNSGEINISGVTNDDAIALHTNAILTLVNDVCAVIDLGGGLIKDAAPSSCVTNNGLIIGGGITVDKATNNAFYDFGGADFSTGSNVVDNGVDVNDIVDGGNSCIIDLTPAATGGMVSYNWDTGTANGADGTLDISGAGLPLSGGTITVSDCSGSFVVSVDVININDADCDGVPTSEDCDDNDPLIGSSANDNDCDGIVTSEDCDDNDPLIGSSANDNDCDGVVTADDCDDNDPLIGSSANDNDCDGVVTADDCDDNDPLIGSSANDEDCDGVVTADDCDDNDPLIGSSANDNDCDGVVTADDCDDNDPLIGISANDNDCDGIVTSEDCDDNDPNNNTLITSSGVSNISCNDGGTANDPNDDFITFDLNPTGFNLGNAYTITGASVSPSGGSYGSSTNFSTLAGTAGAGNLNIIIEDNNGSTCTWSEIILDPGTCSNVCDIVNSGLSNVTCNDNGTPADPADDFITFDLNPTGNNLGTNYNIVGAAVTPTVGTYGTVTNFSTAQGTAGNGDINFTIIDAMDSSCSILETVSDPGSCSANCQMVSLGLTNVTCNDNGTPADATDDFITFDLNPTGNNLGTGFTVTGATLTANTGSYGSVTNFSTTPGTAGAGDLNITVSDDSNTSCSLQDMIVDPGTCSGTCNLTASGLSNIQCNDGGTPSDPNDDFITFDLDPTGGNLGTNYTLSGSAVTPSGGNYGAITSYSTTAGTAGIGDLNLTIIDGLTANCTFGLSVIDPGSCSSSCELTASGLANIQCNDNGTPSDSSDDYFTFELNPMGSNLGNSYQISGGTVSPILGNYGIVTIFSTQPGSAGMGDLNITISDDSNTNCSLNETVNDTGSCSNACSLVASGLTNIQCNDNGTPNDSTDDFITFDLNPTGGNLGTTYILNSAGISPSGGNYGSVTSFATTAGTAGAGDLNIIIVDDLDSNCSIAETITDPGTCSSSCNISDAGISNIQCNDNGTPSDPTDDYMTFDLNPTGANLGANYIIGGGTVIPSGGNYGTTTNFSTAVATAGNGDLNLTITDGTSANCMTSFVINDPGTCSIACTLIASGITNITCNDNGTPSDDTDDFITFDLNPTGNNLGTSYTVSGAVVSPSGGNYGNAISFATTAGTAGAGDLNIIITDDADASCSLSETIIDPGSCSGTCNLTDAGLTNIQCNDNGTPTDSSDDYFTFELNPIGNILGTGYSITGVGVTPTNATYGSSTTFTTALGTAGAGDLNISITDDVDMNCSLSVTVGDPGTCSIACTLIASGITNITCNDNGTPSDDTDDFITFDLNPTGNNLGTSYTVSGAVVSPSGGNYGSATSFATTAGTAGSGDLNITITDDADASCSLSETIIDPGSCSGTCNLTDAGLTNIQCNDNGTPADTSDDFITFDLSPTGTGLGNSYTISGSVVTPLVGNYGSITSFSTQAGTAGAGDLNLTITDAADNNCSLNTTVIDPGVCLNCPTIEANITPLSGVCSGEPIDLEFIFNGGTAPYTVRFSDGQGINEVTSGGGSISTFTVTPTATTTYTITEAFDANNCPATPGASVTVEVFAEAINTFSDSFCEGESYQLPDGTMVTSPDTYEVTLAGQSINGCDSTITINLSQNQSFDFAETIVVCDADSYTWNGQTYTMDGTFTASLQSVTGCDSLRTLNLTFDGLAIYGAADAGADSEECNTEAELFGMDVAGTTGLWTSPTGATITPTNQGAAIVSNLQSGNNTFVWSISTLECADFSRDTTVINVLSNAIELQSDFGVFRNTEPIQLSVLANDNLGGTEQFTLSCINLPQGIESCRFDETTQQLNIEIGKNALGSLEFEYVVCPEACPDLCDTTTVTLDITNDQDQVDYVITPENADGRNDFLFFDNIDQFPDNELVVYNRWGSVIYRAQPYQNDWSGLYNGTRLPEADYYYVLRKELPEKIEFGIVTIKY